MRRKREKQGEMTMKRKLWCALLAALLALFVWVPQAGAEPVEPQAPQSAQELRQAVVQHAQELAAVEWHCVEDVDFSHAVYWSTSLRYKAGTVYHGLPYTSDRVSANANLDEFLAQLDETGTYVGPVTWNEMPGSDCGGQVRIAWAWAGALCGKEMEEFSFHPGADSRACGLIPLGDYDDSGFTTSNSTHNSVLQPNGEQKMYDCYALLDAGDSLFVMYADGGEHIMLVTGKPTVVQDKQGGYMPEQCIVPVLELNSAVHDKGEFKSSWNDQSYTFKSLYDIGFIPQTLESFQQESFAAPTFETENVNVSGSVGFHDLMSGRVLSNYNVFTLTATLTDGQGNVAAQGVSYPNSLRAELAELDYSRQLLELAEGDYHFTLVVKTGLGQQTVADADIHYAPPSGAPVVYISDDGTGNGASPEAPLGNGSFYGSGAQMSYRDSAFSRALEMLAHTGGTVVLCGDVTLLSGRGLSRYSNILSPFTAPVLSSEETVTLTANYGGVDYRQSGAELILQRSRDQAVELELNIGSEWTDLDVRLDYNYSMLPTLSESSIYAYVACMGHKTVINDTVSVSLSQAGQPLDGEQNSRYYPRLYGGSYNLSIIADSDLTVLGGTWSTVVGGSCSAYQVGGAQMTIGGSARVYSGIFGGGAANDGAICGSVSVLINGGTVAGKLVAGSASAFRKVPYSILFKVTGTPDLSGVRIINAGGDANASAIVMDLGEFEHDGESFTAYYNEADFTQIIGGAQEAPAGPGPGLWIAVGGAVALLAAAAVIVLTVKKKKAAH